MKSFAIPVLAALLLALLPFGVSGYVLGLLTLAY